MIKLLTKRIKLNLLFKLSYLNSNFELTPGYLNPALNNSAQGMKSSFGYTSPRISWNPPPKCFHFFEIIYFFLGTGSHKMADIIKLIDAEQRGSFYVSGKLPTYPSPKLTLTLSSYSEQNVGLRDG